MTTIYQQNVESSYNPVLQTVKKSTTSNKYQFISSNSIGKFFESQGFTCEGVSHANVRKEEKRGFQKHLMLFSRPDLLIDGDNKLQLLVQNSHDSSSSLTINTGVWRAVCANGLVSGNDLFTQKVRHIGKSINDQLKESLYYILGHMAELKDQVQAMKNTTLNYQQSDEFIKNVVEMRFDKVKNVHSIDLTTVDRIRRSGDMGQDLYTVFNRVQESVIKGGIRYTKKIEKFNTALNGDKVYIGTDYKNGTTRAVTNIKKSIDLNKAIWNQATSLVA